MTIRIAPNVSPRIITVPASDGTEIYVQSLVNQIREWEQEPAHLSYPKLLNASGKQNLGGGLLVGITATLQNGKLKFEDRLGPNWIRCDILGGNLVAVDEVGNPIDPIESAAYVTVYGARDVSAGLIAEWSQEEKNTILSSINKIEDKIAPLPSDPASETTIKAVKSKTDNLPTDPASESVLKTHIMSEVDDLITRSKGLNEIHDEMHNPDGVRVQRIIEECQQALEEIKGVGWTNQSLKRLSDLIDEIEVRERPPKARFEI